MSRRVLLVLLCMKLLTAAQTKVLSDQRNSSAVSVVLLGAMDDREFISFADAALGSQSVRVGKVVLYATVRDRNLGGPQEATDCTYDSWRSLHATTARVCVDVKEAVKLNSAITFRKADRKCNFHKKLLRGEKDPLTPTVLGSKTEILFFDVKPRTGKPGTFSLEAFVQSADKVTARVARALTEELKESTGIPEVTVTLRADAWFFDQCGFPVLYPFATKVQFPTKEVYLSSKVNFCSVLPPWEIKCW